MQYEHRGGHCIIGTLKTRRRTECPVDRHCKAYT
jgi:hypothetical protein